MCKLILCIPMLGAVCVASIGLALNAGTTPGAIAGWSANFDVQNDIQNDKKDLKKDKQDLRNDRKDARKEQRPTPCCNITKVDFQTGLVTAHVTGTGQAFQFKVTDSRVLASLHAAQPIYANFSTHQVSVDSVTPCGNITSLGGSSSLSNPGAQPSEMALQSGQTSQQLQNGNPQSKAKPSSQKPTDAGKNDLAPATTITPGPEPSTMTANRGARSGNSQGQANAPITVKNTPKIIFPPPVATANTNPNQLPNLAAAISGGLAECGYYPPQSCQSACSSIVVRTYIGVKNTTQYPVSGTIEVLLQDMSGNTVRRWTVNGLAGNGEAYPGKISLPFQCVAPGTEGTIQETPYVLIVKAPPGVTELDPNDNRLQFYVRPGSTISP